MSSANLAYATEEQMEPKDAAAYCFEKHQPAAQVPESILKSIAYKPDGHFYATASVALAAGLEPSRAFALAYFSQYPDLEKDYDAVSVGLRYSYRFWQWGWRTTVLAKLHSLHGGDHEAVNRRRSDLSQTLSDLIGNSGPDWQAGLVIHAFGDSYAHTQTIEDYGSDEEAAYGPIIGHAVDSLFGPDPDIVKHEKKPQYLQKYLDYTTALFKSLRQPNASEERFESLLTYYRQMECGKTCPTFFEPLPKSENEADRTALEGYQSCMLKQARKLSQSEVYSVTNRF